MKQPHTESGIKHTDDQQNTGNHKKPNSPGAGGADRVGGTRAGAENVESVSRDSKAESVETGTDVSKVSGLDEVNASSKQTGATAETGLTERTAERDEHGRL